jgi:hypothetical protein
MKNNILILTFLLSAVLVTGCASDGYFQVSGSGSGSNDTSAANTDAQDAINRDNAQAASDAAFNAAQQQFIAGMAAAQETENHANDEVNQNGLH